MEKTEELNPPGDRRRPLRHTVLATGALGALLLAGCAAEDPDQTTDPDDGQGQEQEQDGQQSDSQESEEESPQGGESGRDLAEDSDFAAFYDQDPDWESCEDDMLCAAVEVPLDYEDPEGQSIEIQMIRSNTARDDAPHVLTNPGGPGSSGYDTVARDLQFFYTPELLDEVEVVGFDPRGVHRSAPVECLTDEEMDESREWVADAGEELDDEAAIEQAREDARWLGEQCLENTGEVLGQVDTASAARDMDIIRAALGEEQLHYLGFSYGTHLGIRYAEAHPESVGRFVLDGMMDTSISDHELTLAQARGFEEALQGYAEWCVEQEDCPVDGEPEDVVTAVADLFDSVSEEPEVAPDGRMIPVTVLVSGFIQPMYSPSGWPMLNEALTAALDDGDFFAFQQWADLAAGRESDGSYDWKSPLAFQAIMCLDYPVSEDDESIEDEYDQTVEASPTFGPYLGHLGVTCAEWPFDPVNEPSEPQIDGSEDMLFIGTTGDPATPVDWAENMHEMVEASSLMIFDGEGHLAYRPGNSCVTDVVDDFLITGELFEGREDC